MVFINIYIMVFINIYIMVFINILDSLLFLFSF